MTTKITASPQFRSAPPPSTTRRYPPPGWPRFVPGEVTPVAVDPERRHEPPEDHPRPVLRRTDDLPPDDGEFVSPPSGGDERLLFAAVAFAGLLVPLNATMIAVALPDIREEFGVSRGAIAWLLSSYLIATTVAQPIVGALGDQLGRARVLRVGLLVFLICSLAAAVVPWFELLVVCRVGQAASSATFIPTGIAMLRSLVPRNRLGRKLGRFESVAGTAAAIGPLIGALLIAIATWRLLFLVNVPIVAVAFWLLMRLDYRDRERARRPLIDWVGAALLVGILSGITWLFGAFDTGVGDIAILGITAAVVLLSVGFVTRQVRGAVVMAPWGLFRRPSFAAAIGYALMTNLVFYVALLSIPFFIREVQGGSVARIGLLLGTMSVLYAVVPLIAGGLSDRVGRRVPTLLGALFIFAGVVMVAVGLAPDVPFFYLAIALGLIGSGIGLGASPATTAAIEIAPADQAGAVGGTDQMVTYVGGIIGAGVVAVVLDRSGAAADIDLFRTVFVVASVVAALTVVTSLVIHTRVVEART
jgi:DHA2 family methylenomycin A resistance protein-like MFS transporter